MGSTASRQDGRYGVDGGGGGGGAGGQTPRRDSVSLFIPCVGRCVFFLSPRVLPFNIRSCGTVD